MSPEVHTLFGAAVPSAVEEQVRERTLGLDQYPGQVLASRVEVDTPCPGGQPLAPAQIHLTITLPGEEWTIRREVAGGGEQNLAAAVGEAFDIAGQLLADDARRQGRVGGGHDLLPHARVRVVELDGHCGLLEAADGRMIDFQESGLVNADLASVGGRAEVVYVEGPGGRRSRAAAVRVIRRGGV